MFLHVNPLFFDVSKKRHILTGAANDDQVDPVPVAIMLVATGMQDMLSHAIRRG